MYKHLVERDQPEAVCKNFMVKDMVHNYKMDEVMTMGIIIEYERPGLSPEATANGTDELSDEDSEGPDHSFITHEIRNDSPETDIEIQTENDA